MNDGIYTNSETSTVPELIRAAQKSVDIEIYEMADLQVRAAIRDALKHNVKVRIIKEPKPIGQKCDPFGTQATSDTDCSDQRKLVAEVKAKGSFVPFASDNLCGQKEKTKNCFEHGKIIIVDDNIALISTGNFNASNLCDIASNPPKCNRDYSVMTHDKIVVETLKEIFEHDLKGQRYDLAAIVKRPHVAERMTVSPFSKEPLLNFLRSAKKKIQIQNQYIRANSDIPEVLLELAKKGVEIEVQLADACSFGHVSEHQAYEMWLEFAALESAGVKVRMFNKAHKIKGKEGYLHAKAIVVDNSKAWIGSVNGSTTSINENREFGVFDSDAHRVASLASDMKKDFEDPTSQTWRDSVACHNVGYQDKDAAKNGSPRPTETQHRFKKSKHHSKESEELME